MPDALGRRPAHGHIVIVDDSEEVRRSLSLLLRARGYRTALYNDGPDLLADLPNDALTCFLIDYKLPNMDGIDLMEELRARGMKAPALMITGFFSPGLKEKAMEKGFSGVVEKPLPVSQLLSEIATLDRDPLGA